MPIKEEVKIIPAEDIAFKTAIFSDLKDNKINFAKQAEIHGLATQDQINSLDEEKADLGHKHTISEITDISSILPSGCILMWSGLLVNIPSGFYLCDGNNSTPDLRDKFIKGSASGIDPGVTGGATTHDHDDHAIQVHAGTAVDNHSAKSHVGMTISNHAAQSHSGTAVANHSSVTFGYDGVPGAGTVTHSVTQPKSHPALEHSFDPPDNHPAMSHSVTQPNDHPVLAHNEVSNEPVYYSLAFIMKG